MNDSSHCCLSCDPECPPGIVSQNRKCVSQTPPSCTSGHFEDR
jgi:hypothetical protein